MGPYIQNNSSQYSMEFNDREELDDFNLEEFENDGWQIGYEVEMNGIGVLNDNETNSADNEDSDSENDELNARKFGYRLLTDRISNHEEDKSVDDEQDETEEVKASYPNFFDFINKNLLLTSKELIEASIPHKPVEFILKDESIVHIKDIMANIKITPPSWAKSIDDKDLTELIKSFKNKI